MSHAPRFLKLVNDARKCITECDINAVKEKQEANHDFILIDVREHSEWEKGHLPKAIHLCKGIIERDIEKSVNDINTEIVLYCGGGYRSAIAAKSLKKMGYTNVISMDGGFRVWKEAELEVVVPLS